MKLERCSGYSPITNNLYSHNHTFQKVMGIPGHELKTIISTMITLIAVLWKKNIM